MSARRREDRQPSRNYCDVLAGWGHDPRALSLEVTGFFKDEEVRRDFQEKLEKFLESHGFTDIPAL